MISDNNSAHIQRQNGDFSGLRDKVIRLHTQFELVTKGGPEALERTLAMISKASSSLPMAIEKKQTDDGKIQIEKCFSSPLQTQSLCQADQLKVEDLLESLFVTP